MRHSVGLISVCLACMFATASLRAEENGGPLPDVPELAVLSNYVGSFSAEMSLTNPNEPGQETEFKGTTEAHWILGGRYVEQTTTLKQVGESESVIQVRNMLTYDPKKQVYRTYQFLSTGPERIVSEGVWKAEQKVMKLTAQDVNDGNTITTKADFSKPGEEHWVITVLNAQGEVSLTIEGKNIRKR